MELAMPGWTWALSLLALVSGVASHLRPPPRLQGLVGLRTPPPPALVQLQTPAPHSLLDMRKDRLSRRARAREPSEDGAVGVYFLLPDGSDMSERMCHMYGLEHPAFFADPNSETNTSCVFYVVRLEAAFAHCSAERDLIAENISFSHCIESERPATPPEEICRDLFNASAVNATPPGGEPYTTCMKDADLVQLCVGQCGQSNHTRYSFLECVEDCYHFNITEEAKTPIPEPTTPPIPPALHPIIGHMWNVSTHLDALHGNFRNMTWIAGNVTAQFDERFPKHEYSTTMPPYLLENATEEENKAPALGLLSRLRRGLRSMLPHS